MKNLYLFLLLLPFISCKKTKEQVQENLIITAMTNGQWKVTNITINGADKTGDFSNYKFQFKTNQTVDAINSGNVEKTGTWNASTENQTITSNFNLSTQPLIWLNGIWKVNSTTWTSVNASIDIQGESRTLRLDKL